ncbi:hypothetical protein E4U34_003378 [Claviceps purpurea]|nr:hypothetical protein E4U28_001735 [Claviceps purpurea]KAG6185176.1 hypothetical protein E4U36_001470 [Claviceps purpurea]KAG6229094.1 hypothetical protein E4U34_003378 [Claviceps purpurea]
MARPGTPRLFSLAGAGTILCRRFSRTAAVQADFTHTIIGGGIIGLSIAHHLSLQPNTSTLLLERHPSLGSETSSRNSEVIHAGIYYPPNSLKTKLCLRGRDLLYRFCETHRVGHRRTGKWIVAQTDDQLEQLQKLYEHCRGIGVPMRWLSEAEVQRHGEGVRARKGALESPCTGIVDIHGVMLALEGLLEEKGAVIALNSRVVGVRRRKSAAGDDGSGSWEIDVRDEAKAAASDEGDDGSASATISSITSETVVNAAGLGAVDVHNMIVPDAQRKTMYYAKGNYFSYSKSWPRISRLIYPAPNPGAAGLGTHLTLDLSGRVRFGPDIEWVSDPNDLSVSSARLERAIGEIKTYLPGVDETCLQPDYAGIRPKLTYKGAGQMGSNFNDFVVRLEPGYPGWVNCLGIESPGLTSSLAIGERVRQLLYGE